MVNLARNVGKIFYATSGRYEYDEVRRPRASVK